jgi:hypothetical protein
MPSDIHFINDWLTVESKYQFKNFSIFSNRDNVGMIYGCYCRLGKRKLHIFFDTLTYNFLT